MKKLIIITATLSSLLLSVAVSAEQTDTLDGKALFEEKCAMCHRIMGMGAVVLERRMAKELAPLENRQVPAALVQHVVRNGLGVMFPIPRAEVSDAQLDAIASYLDKPRDNHSNQE